MGKVNLNLKEIGGRLKEARKAISKTMQEVAEAFGLSIRTILNMEKGLRNPDAKYLLLLHSEFNINLNWLLSGTGSMFADFEIKSDFGTDIELMKEIIYVMEHAPIIRYNIFTHYLQAKNSDREYVEEILTKR